MTYFAPYEANKDAFLRERVSNPATELDLKQLYEDPILFWSDAELSGGSTTSSYSANRSSTIIGVTGNVAGKRGRQSKIRGFYQPGKGLAVLMTGVIVNSTSAAVTRRWGYFDSSNGLFFKEVNGALSVNVRSYVTGSPVDTSVAQASFNLDKLDGTGDSGKTLDLTKSNIFFIDFEWLGVGGVRFGVVIDNELIYCHQVNNGNTLTSVYMTNPNLPVRYEIETTGAGAASSFEIETICATVMSEGGSDNIVKPVVVSRGTTAAALSTAIGTYTPIISVRLRDGFFSRINPEAVSLYVPTASTEYRWILVLNPTVGGSDPATFGSTIANSSIEYDVSRTSANPITGGYILADGYGSATNQNKQVIEGSNDSYLTLGHNIDGTKDQLVLAVTRIASTGAADCYGSLKLGEYI